MVKILQHLRILKMWYLRHAEHHTKNRTSLCGLDHETLFFDWPLMSSHLSTRLCLFVRLFVRLLLSLWSLLQHNNMIKKNTRWSQKTDYLLSFRRFVFCSFSIASIVWTLPHTNVTRVRWLVISKTDQLVNGAQICHNFVINIPFQHTNFIKEDS